MDNEVIKRRRKRRSNIQGNAYYYDAVKGARKLSMAEEYRVIKSIRDGTISDADYDNFILINLPNIYYIATDIIEKRRAGELTISFEDLVQAGIQGLIHAAIGTRVQTKAQKARRERKSYLFDPKKCLRFSTYSYNWIYKYCIIEFEKNNRIKVPSSVLYSTIRKVNNKEALTCREADARNAMSNISTDSENYTEGEFNDNHRLSFSEEVSRYLKNGEGSPEAAEAARIIKESPLYDILFLNESFQKTMEKFKIKDSISYNRFVDQERIKLLKKLQL